MEKTSLAEQVYALCRQIPPGKVTTYKELAKAVGVNSYRAVGQVLKRNPDPHGTPCYRVVNSTGEIGGYFGKKTSEKARKLKEEGIIISNGKIDLKKYFHSFKSRRYLS